MRKLILIPLLLLAFSCSKQNENVSPSTTNKTDKNPIRKLQDPVFRVDSVTLITTSNPEFLKLAATPEYQASLDAGDNTSWYKIHTNVSGLVVLVTRATELLGNNHGLIEWRMDTITSANHGIITIGTRYLYSSNIDKLDGYSGNETIYAPFSDNFVSTNTFYKGLNTGTVLNPNIGPGSPERPWKDNEECMKYTSIRFEALEPYTGVPAHLGAVMSCYFDLLFGIDAIDQNLRLLP